MKMNWTDELIHNIELTSEEEKNNEVLDRFINKSMNNTVADLNKSFSEKKLRYLATKIENKIKIENGITIASKITCEFTEDFILKASNKSIKEIIPSQIDKVIHDEILKLYRK